MTMTAAAATKILAFIGRSFFVAATTLRVGKGQSCGRVDAEKTG